MKFAVYYTFARLVSIGKKKARVEITVSNIDGGKKGKEKEKGKKKVQPAL